MKQKKNVWVAAALAAWVLSGSVSIAGDLPGAAVDRFFGAYRNASLAGMLASYAPNAVFEDVNQRHHFEGTEQLTQLLGQLVAMHQEMDVKEKRRVVDGNTVVVEYEYVGTLDGAVLGQSVGKEGCPDLEYALPTTSWYEVRERQDRAPARLRRLGNLPGAPRKDARGRIGELGEPLLEPLRGMIPRCRGGTFGNYRVVELLGKGGMGEVYRARDERLGRDVAIKMLPPELAAQADRLSRFEREARLLASLNHANIAAIYGLEQVNDQHCLILELVEGEDLALRIQRGALPVDEAIGIATQIAEGVQAAHDKGVIHRDLKPANIKIGSEGEVKILDFGLAKAISGESQAESESSAPVGESPTLTPPDDPARECCSARRVT